MRTAPERAVESFPALAGSDFCPLRNRKMPTFFREDMAACPLFDLFFDEEGKSEADKPPPEKKDRFATCDEK